MIESRLKTHNQNKQTNQLAFVVGITIIFLLGGRVLSYSQAAGIGVKFGSRDPRTCANKTLPKNGPPSAAQAAQYVICGHEQVIELLYLDEDVTVQVGKGRPYNMKEDYNCPNIDVKLPVYPIQGSFKQYSCSPIRSDRSNLNRNCALYTAPNATGLCYKDVFGDWHCSLNDARTGDFTARNVAPPGGGRTTINTEENNMQQGNKRQQDNKSQQMENKNLTSANKDENGFPKVDFTALEPWFEVLRYEYQPTEERIYLYLKPKVDKRETQFLIEFRDKDGILLQSRESGEFLGIPSKYDVATGETTKAYTITPKRNILKQAASAKIVRRL